MLYTYGEYGEYSGGHGCLDANGALPTRRVFWNQNHTSLRPGLLLGALGLETRRSAEWTNPCVSSSSNYGFDLRLAGEGLGERVY